MAHKIYNEKTNEFYDPPRNSWTPPTPRTKPEDLVTLEKSVLEARIDMARKEYEVARENYRRQLEEYTRKYGQFPHNPIIKEMVTLFDILKDSLEMK